MCDYPFLTGANSEGQRRLSMRMRVGRNAHRKRAQPFYGGVPGALQGRDQDIHPWLSRKLNPQKLAVFV